MANAKRPHVICHMMSTIDGKIASGKEADILGDYFDLYTQTENMLTAKAWMCGRITMQMFAVKETTPLPIIHQEIDENDFIVEHENNLFMFGVDTKGLLRWKKNTIQLSNISKAVNLVIIVTKSTPKAYLAYLQSKNISYLFAGDDEIDFNIVFKSIKEKLRVEKLLLEGGGLLNGSVMAAGFVDEISLIVTPIVVNRSQAPSVFEKVTQAIEITHFMLMDVQKLDKNSVWLRYKNLYNQ